MSIVDGRIVLIAGVAAVAIVWGLNRRRTSITVQLIQRATRAGYRAIHRGVHLRRGELNFPDITRIEAMGDRQVGGHIDGEKGDFGMRVLAPNYIVKPLHVTSTWLFSPLANNPILNLQRDARGFREVAFYEEIEVACLYRRQLVCRMTQLTMLRHSTSGQLAAWQCSAASIYFCAHTTVS